MTDDMTREQRSYTMSRIRSKGSEIEDILFRLVRDSLGERWRVERNVISLPGRPDVVVPELRLAIFADGCFFHWCAKHARPPRSNRSYWVPKLKGNAQRDKRNRACLRRRGYGVWRFWAHDLRGGALVKTSRTVTARLSARILAIREEGATLYSSGDVRQSLVADSE
jgi:DNA mismatch endonuclease (patch repair protein)